MADGNRGFLLAPAGDEAVVLGGEVARAAPSGVRRFGQGHPQPHVPLAGLPTRALAGALVLARAHRPGGTRPRRRDARLSGSG